MFAGERTGTMNGANNDDGGKTLGPPLLFPSLTAVDWAGRAGLGKKKRHGKGGNGKRTGLTFHARVLFAC